MGGILYIPFALPSLSVGLSLPLAGFPYPVDAKLVDAKFRAVDNVVRALVYSAEFVLTVA